MCYLGWDDGQSRGVLAIPGGTGLLAIASYSDCTGLLEIINRQFPVRVDRVTLHREMIGHVYFAEGGRGKYVLKIFRSFHTANALDSISVIRYLGERCYPVASIVPTVDGRTNTTIDTPGGNCVALMYKHVAGPEPHLETEITSIGTQVARLHELMKGYPHPLPKRGKEFYIDRYISLLAQKRYPAQRIRELADLGEGLWRRMEGLPSGFCHGDLHTGNMVQTQSGTYVLLDFDVAALSRSVIDVATLCDGTDFNNLDPAGYELTLRRFEAFYRGYSRVSTLTAAEIDAIVDFIPIRHFEIIATIVGCQGLDEVSLSFLDEQYRWLLRWEEICDAARLG